MIDLTQVASQPSVSKKFLAALDHADDNDTGTLDNREIESMDDEDLHQLATLAESNAEWNLIAELAKIHGTYQSLLGGEPKGMDPGEGGRFALMVDRLMARGYSQENAEKIAVSIGQQKYAWMR